MCIFNTHSVLTKINICWKRAQRFITRHLHWVKLGLCGDVYKKPAVSKYTPPAALRVRALSSAAAWASHAVFFYSKCVFSSSNAGFPFGPVIRAAGTGIKLVKVLWFMCLLSDAVIIIRCFWWEHRHPLSGFVFLSFLLLGDSPELIMFHLSKEETSKISSSCVKSLYLFASLQNYQKLLTGLQDF